MLPQVHRVRSASDIRRIIKNGAYCESPFVRVWWLPGATPRTRIACVVGRRVHARAVKRHRFQRWLRSIAAEVIAAQNPEPNAVQGPAYDMVWVAKPAMQHAESLAEVYASLTPCFKKVWGGYFHPSSQAAEQ